MFTLDYWHRLSELNHLSEPHKSVRRDCVVSCWASVLRRTAEGRQSEKSSSVAAAIDGRRRVRRGREENVKLSAAAVHIGERRCSFDAIDYGTENHQKCQYPQEVMYELSRAWGDWRLPNLGERGVD